MTGIQKRLVDAIKDHSIIRDRVQRLLSTQGIGEITALTWVLEIGEPERFHSIAQAVSYCGLCSAQKESAGKQYRSPISKKRNKHLQTVLVEAAKLVHRDGIRIWPRYIKRSWPRATETRQP